MKIKASTRELLGKKVKQLRRNGIVPATLYGPKTNPENLQVDRAELLKIFREAGYSQFVELDVEGQKARKVLIKELRKHPVDQSLVMDVSFYQADEKAKITVEVPINVVGESPAIKQNIGFLVTNMNTIKVHCLPKDLPNQLDVDISKLATDTDVITVGDIVLPTDVELDSSMDSTSAVLYIGTAQKEAAAEAKAEAEQTTAEAATEETTEGAAEGDKKEESAA